VFLTSIDSSHGSSRWWRLMLPVALISVFVAVVLLSDLRMSQTFDEGFHLAAGYRYLQCGDFGINSEHPPLVKMVAALALRITHTPPPSAGVCGQEETTKDHGYLLGLTYLYKQGLDAQAVLFKGRAATVVFAVALLTFVFFYARNLFGYWTAIVALLLAVSEPTLIAHAALVTTDMAASAGLMAAVFSLDVYLRRRTPLSLLMAGLGCGFALSFPSFSPSPSPISFWNGMTKPKDRSAGFAPPPQLPRFC
jgi:Dolichyl-phosphate-mannose-protein mannosyltransferase